MLTSHHKRKNGKIKLKNRHMTWVLHDDYTCQIRECVTFVDPPSNNLFSLFIFSKVGKTLAPMVWLMFYTEKTYRETQRESSMFLTHSSLSSRNHYQSMHIINHAFYYAFGPSVFLNSHVTALLRHYQNQQQQQ